VGCAGYDGQKRRRGSNVHVAVETLSQLLALLVAPANEQDRAQVSALAATGQSVEVAFVDQGHTGEEPARAAAEHGIRLEVVELPKAQRGFVLSSRRRVVDRSFAWASEFRGSAAPAAPERKAAVPAVQTHPALIASGGDRYENVINPCHGARGLARAPDRRAGAASECPH
jgi:transposase